MNVLEHYNKEHLHLSDPFSLDDDTYFSKFSYNKMPFIIKTNKVCYLKNSNKNSNNFIHISLTSKDYLIWFETFYKDCIQLFYEKSSDWFEDPLSLSDIEFSFINPLKSNIKDNCFDVQCITDDNRLNVIDSNENVHNLENIKDSRVVPTFHIRGVKFNNKYFTFEIELNNLYIILDDNSSNLSEPLTNDNPVTVHVPPNITQSNDSNELNNSNVINDSNEINESNESNEINEFELPLNDLENSKMELNENNFLKIYEIVNTKIKDNLVENLRNIFIQKKIKKDIDLTEMIDDEDI